MVLCTILAMAAFVADLRLQPGGQRTTRVIDDLTQCAAAFVLALSAARQAQQTAGRLRLSWALIGLGAAGWGAGQTIWSYYEVIRNAATPFPSLADAGYLLLPTLAFGGVLVRPSLAFSGRGRVRVGLDVLLVLVSLFSISWATTFGEVYRGTGGNSFARVVSLAYPAGDIALLTVVVVVVAYASSRAGLLLLGGGLALFAVADSAFAYLTATGRYATGNLVDAFWVAGFLVMAWAARLDCGQSSRQGARSSYVAVVLPFVPTVIGLAVVALREGSPGGDELLLRAGAVMVVVLLVRQVVVVSDNHRLLEQMRYQAFHDPLTRLFNRALFNDRLTHALDLHSRDRRGLAVLLIDLDNFKIVNDSLGHLVGDDLLVAVANRLRAATRAGDTVARLGGDEFAIMLETSLRADELATRILASFAEPLPVGGQQIQAGGSIGIAVLGPHDEPLTAIEMMQRADIAMYAAKRAGKGMSRTYSGDMALLASGELDLQAALVADLAAGRIDVAYQPVFGADGRRVVGFEALARWSFRGQPVSPVTFLAVARELGCVNLLDEAVLNQAVETAAVLPGLLLGVNVDQVTLAQPGYASRVLALLASRHVKPARLIIEVLEVDPIEDDSAALESLRALRAGGVRICIDDFGAGYASLARVRALEPAYIKIDRSLVETCEEPMARALLEAAASIGRLVGAHVVAEGVETQAQLRATVEAGCDALQGFHLARPMPEPELRAFVARRAAALASAAAD